MSPDPGAPDDDLRDLLRALEKSPRDSGTWERFFVRLWPFVLASACRAMAGSPQPVIDAEDVAQEVFFQFARFWHSGKGGRPTTGEHLRHLLTGMTRRQSHTSRRLLLRERRDARRNRPLGDGDFAEARPLVQALVEFNDLLERIRTDLDPQDRRLVQMLLDGHTEMEIAAALGVTDRTIRRRLIGVRKVIRKHILASDLN